MGRTVRAVRCVVRVIDPFVALLLATLTLAGLVPASGRSAEVVSVGGTAAVSVLFFLSGARLAPGSVLRGMTDWRLQLTILAFTFVAFPLAGLAVSSVVAPLLSPELVVGVLFLSALPSVVQTSTAFTSLAGGNTAASVCAASVSNLLGVVLTPVLLTMLTGSYAGVGAASALTIVVQILVPFAVGQLLHRRLGTLLRRRARVLRHVDRAAILLIVYSAFGRAVLDGVWQRTGWAELVLVTVLCAGLLGLALAGTARAGRLLGLPRESRIPLLFCGSEKSLTTGLPIAAILFTGPAAGVVVIPVIIYHQLQLVVSALVARRLAPAAV